MAFKDWSTTAASNGTADAGINWQEGQAPSTVNGSAREMMAVLKKAFGYVASGDDFGALGDGVTDDTTSLQSALDSGAKEIILKPGSTYILSQTGTKTIHGTAHRYCLVVPNNVTFNLNGATLKLASAQNAALLINNASSTTCSDITVIGGLLDGNETNQTTPATGDMPCLFLHNVVRPRVENLRVINARQYFGRFLQCEQGYFNRLHGSRSDGDGWSFGVGSNSQHLTNSFVDNIYAEDCTNGVYGALQGNGAIFTAKYCNVGKVETVNCGGGLKIQSPAQDSTYGQLIFRGGANNTSNSGVKLQGQSGQKDLLRVSVGQILSEGCHSQGLAWSESMDCHVGSYMGYNNGATGNIRDVDIQSSDRPSFGSIKSVLPGASPNIFFGTDVTGLVGSEITVYDGVGRGVLMGAETAHIHTVNVFDGPTQAQTEAIHVASTASKGRVDVVTTNLDPDTDPTKQIVYISVITTNFEFGKIVFGGSSSLEGVVTLSNGASSTAVANDNIWEEFVGTSGTDHYFTPIIQIVPWNSTAMALLASGGFRTTINRLVTVGTGFTIRHGAAGATDRVYWKVLGWKVAEREPA